MKEKSQGDGWNLKGGEKVGTMGDDDKEWYAFHRNDMCHNIFRGMVWEKNLLNISPTLDNELNFVSGMCREYLCRQRVKLTKLFMASIVQRVFPQ